MMKFEPSAQITPKALISWSMLSFGLDPLKEFSITFDGCQRGREFSINVMVKATGRIGDTEMGEFEANVNGIAAKPRL
jgi:hypothetical protein